MHKCFSVFLLPSHKIIWRARRVIFFFNLIIYSILCEVSRAGILTPTVKIKYAYWMEVGGDKQGGASSRPCPLELNTESR